MRSLRLLCALLVLALAAGCAGGSNRTPVRGKLTNNGKSLLADKKSGITMVFVPAVSEHAAGETYPAVFNPEDDTFEVTGPDGKGIPLGKYRVTLNVMPVNPSPFLDKLNEQYGEGKTPIEVEVTGPQLDIDLANFKK